MFITTRRVEFCHTDLAGIMHFANYYILMEQAEHEFFRSLGLSIMHQRDDGAIVSWPRVSAACTFEAPARYDDELEIRVRVARKGVKSLTFDIEFWRDEQRLAHGTVKTVCCLFRRDEPFRSIDIPEFISEKIVEE